jgi:hypothetical protein
VDRGGNVSDWADCLDDAVNITVIQGNKVNLTIGYVDANGVSIVRVPDSPPIWNAAFGLVTIVPAANGLTATVTALTIGTDSVMLTVIIGGKKYTSTLTVAVVARVPSITNTKMPVTVV